MGSVFRVIITKFLSPEPMGMFPPRIIFQREVHGKFPGAYRGGGIDPEGYKIRWEYSKGTNFLVAKCDKNFDRF